MQRTELELRAIAETATLPAAIPSEMLDSAPRLFDRTALDSRSSGASDDEEDFGNRGPRPAPQRADRHYRNTLQSPLEALTRLYTTHPSMESVLQTACHVVAEILGLEHCSICCLDGQESRIAVRAYHTREGAHVDLDQAICAVSEFVKRVRPTPSGAASSACALKRNRESGRKLELTAPLRVDKRIAGYLHGLRSQPSQPQLVDTEAVLFLTLIQHINTAIEIQRTRELLDCPYAAIVLSPQEKEAFASLSPLKGRLLDSVKSPEELAQKTARRFFSDLRKAGFETKQILSIATEIIDRLTDVLRKAKSGRPSPA